MSDLENTNLIELVPTSIKKDEQIKAAASGIDPELKSVSSSIKFAELYSRIDELTEPVLKMLAWENRVYSYEWALATTIDAKRNLVKNSFDLNKRRGTRWAIERIFELLNIDATIQEWFEYGGQPYRFKVNINTIDGRGLTEEELDTAYRMIDVYKPLRCSVERIGATLVGEDSEFNAGASSSYIGSLNVFVIYEKYVPPAPSDWGPLTRGLNAGNTSQNWGGSYFVGDIVVVTGLDGYAARSDDAGQTFAPLPKGLNTGDSTRNFDALAGNAAGVILAYGGNDRTGARSTDYGETWAVGPTLGAFSGANVNSLATDGGDVFIASTSTGYCYRSNDAGVSFTSLPRGLETVFFENFDSIVYCGGGVFVALGNSGYCARSTDNGVTWSALPRWLALGVTSEPFTASACNLNSGVVIALATNGYACRSTDQGATWVPLPRFLGTSMATSDWWNSIASDDAGRFIAGAHNGYSAYTDDDGANWSSFIKGLNCGSTTQNITTMATNKAGVWVAGFEFGYASISPPNS